MLVDLPQNLIVIVAGAFLLGWIFSAIASRIGDAFRSRHRDPRDDRIRSLEAELRVAQSDAEKAKQNVEQLDEELKQFREDVEKRDNVISHQQGKLEETTRDLKESVMKTRELRAELSDRATENLKSEVKLREVETELEVAQASTDMIATGILDYSLAPDNDGDPDVDEADNGEVSKAAR